MAKLVVRLLGGFRVELDGEVVYGFETDKARALLAYLVERRAGGEPRPVAPGHANRVWRRRARVRCIRPVGPQQAGRVSRAVRRPASTTR